VDELPFYVIVTLMSLRHLAIRRCRLRRHCHRAGTKALVQEAARKRGWGRIVNIASTAGLKGYPFVSAYVAAKHGLVGLTRALGLELARTGVTVNAVCPGFTDTPMTRSAPAEMFAAWEALEPSGKAASPAEIANAAIDAGREIYYLQERVRDNRF
jgi:NAD(P)-dependent dehydrogenase (short-subunit alcohol dehydrogenase family)